MIAIIKRAIAPLAITLATASTPAFAAGSPLGVWIDHTGRGAVEITDCNGKLCGKLVWFKDAKNVKEGCNFQIIGDVKPVAGNKWDGGWIIDPDKDPDKKYDVEITPQGDQKLKVMGYAGHEVPERDHDLDARPGRPQEVRRGRRARSRSGAGRACTCPRSGEGSRRPRTRLPRPPRLRKRRSPTERQERQQRQEERLQDGHRRHRRSPSPARLMRARGLPQPGRPPAATASAPSWPGRGRRA